MKKYEREEQQALATWSADCAERVLPLFEESFPDDDRPRKALHACREWVRTGIFTMAGIRGISLAAHAAARDAKDNTPACLAARAAGQAVATAHVPQHAFGGAYYALKALAAANPVHAEEVVTDELNWQLQHIYVGLRDEVQKRVIVQKRGSRVFITVQKEGDF